VKRQLSRTKKTKKAKRGCASIFPNLTNKFNRCTLRRTLYQGNCKTC